MTATRAYLARGRRGRSETTRRRIVAAVRELLAEGSFHESTVEQVADRVGIARATLYQHFDSRLALVDAICDTFAENPALLALRESVQLDDPDRALRETIANAVRFWSSEQAILGQLYGVAAIDQSARELVERQRADRRGELGRLARRLRRARRLRAGLTERRALVRLMTLTSFETFQELRAEGLSERDISSTLREMAETLLLADESDA